MDIEPMSMAEHDIFLTFQPHALQRLGSIGLHPALQHWWHCGDRLADELSNLWILKSRKKMCIYIYITKTLQRPHWNLNQFISSFWNFAPLWIISMSFPFPSATLTHLPNLPKDLQNILRQPQGAAVQERLITPIDHQFAAKGTI